MTKIGSPYAETPAVSDAKLQLQQVTQTLGSYCSCLLIAAWVSICEEVHTYIWKQSEGAIKRLVFPLESKRGELTGRKKKRVSD